MYISTPTWKVRRDMCEDMLPSSQLTTREVAEGLFLQCEQRKKLLAFAYSRFGILAVDAEDLLQETALELLRQRAYVRKPEAFVFTVFRARCSRFVGGLQRRRALFAGEAAGADQAADPAGADQFDRKVALRQALGTISMDCRLLLSTYYVEGQDLREAARRLSLAYSSISTTLSRCLRKLRECLS